MSEETVSGPIDFKEDPEQEIKRKILELSKPDMLDLRSNLNAMILVLTDFLVLQTELMKKLIEKEVLSEEDVQAVYTTTGDKQIVTQAYAAVYNRYASYFQKAREVIRAALDNEAPAEDQLATIEGLENIQSTATKK